MKKTWPARVARTVLMLGLLGLIAVPAIGAEGGRVDEGRLAHYSQIVAAKYYAAHPDQAPEALRARLGALSAARSGGAKRASILAPPFGDRLNNDVYGLPQNEESLGVCEADSTGVVLEGTNDYRYILNDQENSTGWHLSLDAGQSLANEGLLPAIDDNGTAIPSGGDPVISTPPACNHVYAADLNYIYPFPNGIGVYRSTVSRLAGCDTSDEPFHSNPACWPDRKLVATAPDATHFLDKEWMDVSDTGDGVHVWVTWSDFYDTDQPCCHAHIMASRCDADLSNCTAPQQVSDAEDDDIQFSYVTIGPDHRTYVTWVQVFGELQGTPDKFRIKMRVAEAGSTTFGPTRVIKLVRQPLGFDNFLHAEDFRVATVPKNAVKLVDGQPRVFVTWDECQRRPLGAICEEPRVMLAYSDDLGATWTTMTVSQGGDNYFPTVANDRFNANVVVAYYTNRFDPQFHNRQDVELVTVNGATGAIVRRQRVTTDQSNEPEADWALGGFFIGDYIQVFGFNGFAWVGYNSNIRDVKILGFQGLPVPQQDNYVTALPE